jgi:hypothetical protein
VFTSAKISRVAMRQHERSPRRIKSGASVFKEKRLTDMRA